MSPDEFQKAWKAHSSETRITIDADVLLKEVQRSRQGFRSMILFRDIREAGIAMVMIPLWFVLGIMTSQPWSWYLTVPALLWIAGFTIVDRLRHPKDPTSGAALMDSVKGSLSEVEHQIWLLRNVFWWYLLPCTISILFYFAHTAWLTSGGNWLIAVGIATPFFAFLIVLYGFIYYINQYAVRTQLEPRRQELLNLLDSLNDETSEGVSGEYPLLMAPACATWSRRRLLAIFLCVVVFIVIGIDAIFLIASLDNDYPKLSPFQAVRWQESQPEVQVGDQWFRLMALDGIPAVDIVEFSKKEYGDLWRKRFEEDLVELLTRMGHPPEKSVTLVVRSLTTSETSTLEDVSMTRANRRAIRNAAQLRKEVERE